MIESGQIVDVDVGAVEPYGLHVVCGEHAGLILIPEISWQRVSHPNEFAAVGDRVKCMVVRVTTENGKQRFSASLRQLDPEANPWRDPDAAYAPGKEFTGKVVQKVSYGVFIEHPRKECALLHKDRIPNGIKPEIGEVFDVVILSSDKESRRIEVALRSQLNQPSDAAHDGQSLAL
jgi:small subunit ribosomal protein S1